MGVGTKTTMVVTYVESEFSDMPLSSVVEGIEQAGAHIVSETEEEVEVDEYGWEVES
jgi:hypothetical protein